MVKLNQKDLELLLEIMTEEQAEHVDNMLEHERVPDEMLDRCYTLGRLRVWANEQLLSKEETETSKHELDGQRWIDLAHRTVMSQMNLGHLKYIGDIFLLIIESIKELQENTHE